MLIANIMGISLFLFLYWRKLKEDYIVEKTFDSAVVFLVFITLGLIFSKFFLNAFWFWITFFSLILAFLINTFVLKIKANELLDALAISTLSWLSFYYLEYSVRNSSLSAFLVFWISLISCFLFFLFSNFYRSFTWYKSGKMGFSGLATLGIFLILRSILYIFFPQTISFSGWVDPYLSTTFAFISFLLLFNLSRQV